MEKEKYKNNFKSKKQKQNKKYSMRKTRINYNSSNFFCIVVSIWADLTLQAGDMAFNSQCNPQIKYFRVFNLWCNLMIKYGTQGVRGGYGHPLYSFLLVQRVKRQIHRLRFSVWVATYCPQYLFLFQLPVRVPFGDKGVPQDFTNCGGGVYGRLSFQLSSFL